MTISKLSFVAALFFLTSICSYAAPGDVYVTDAFEGTVVRVTSAGVKTTVISGFSAPTTLAFGDGYLFVGSFGSREITRYCIKGGTERVFASGFNNLTSQMAVDPQGRLIVKDQDASGSAGQIRRYDSAGNVSVLASFAQFSSGLCLGLHGEIIFGDGGTVKELGLNGITVVASGFGTVSSLAVDGQGNYFVADASTNRVWKVSKNGGSKDIFVSSIPSPNSLAFNDSGNLLVLSAPTDGTAGAFFRFSKSGDLLESVTGFSVPSKLAIEPQPQLLRNISTRSHVGTGADILIAGFIAGGSDIYNGGVIVRGIGPSLTALGVPGALQDPVLSIYNGAGDLIASNDDFASDAAVATVRSYGLAPTNAKESALYLQLPSGAYTAQLKGANDGTGVGLIEVYNLK